MFREGHGSGVHQIAFGLSPENKTFNIQRLPKSSQMSYTKSFVHWWKSKATSMQFHGIFHHRKLEGKRLCDAAWWCNALQLPQWQQSQNPSINILCCENWLLTSLPVMPLSWFWTSWKVGWRERSKLQHMDYPCCLVRLEAGTFRPQFSTLTIWPPSCPRIISTPKHVCRCTTLQWEWMHV